MTDMLSKGLAYTLLLSTLFNQRKLGRVIRVNTAHFRASMLWKGLALLAILSFALILSDGLPNAAAQTQNTLVISVDDTSLVEGEDPIMYFTLRLSEPAPYNFEYYWKIVDGTALNGEDYYFPEPSSSSPNGGWPSFFKKGETTSSEPVSIYQDDEIEGPETLKLIIIEVDARGTIGDGEGVGTIYDPEPEEEDQIEFAIMAGDSVSEGGDARFYLLHPPMDDQMTANITISQSGHFAASGQIGGRTITTDPGYTQTSFLVATQNDGRNESNGSITATLNPGAGYAVQSDYSSATVMVLDNDEPAISITPGSSVREGSAAVFGLSAAPPPAAPLEVNVNVTESGFFTASGQTGAARGYHRHKR